MKRNSVFRMAGGGLACAITRVWGKPLSVAYAAAPAYRWPCRGPIPANGRFGDPRPGHAHQGLDIAAAEGVAVQAASPGRVTVAGWLSGYGQVVFVDHGDGRETRYAHLSRLSKKKGDPVTYESIVGHVGHTGNATGPHLHFETWSHGKALDPLKSLPSTTAAPGPKPKPAPTPVTSRPAPPPAAPNRFVQASGPRAGTGYVVVIKDGQKYRFYDNGDKVHVGPAS